VHPIPRANLCLPAHPAGTAGHGTAAVLGVGGVRVLDHLVSGGFQDEAVWRRASRPQNALQWLLSLRDWIQCPAGRWAPALPLWLLQSGDPPDSPAPSSPCRPFCRAPAHPAARGLQVIARQVSMGWAQAKIRHLRNFKARASIGDPPFSIISTLCHFACYRHPRLRLAAGSGYLKATLPHCSCQPWP